MIQNSDVIAVGHFAIDAIKLPSRASSFVILGGAVTYISLVTRRLDETVSVISKVGGDFPEAYLWWLREEGINLSGVIKLTNEQTTRFSLRYTKDLSNRTLRLKSKAPPLTPDDLPSSLQAKAVHIVPIAGEISYEVIEKLKGCTEVLSLDPQGLVRSFDKTGKATPHARVDKRVFSLINICKFSLEEIQVITDHSDIKSAIKAIHDFGVETLIVTLGAKGAVLSVENTLYNIPAFCPRVYVDPTGAGDVFIGGFLAEYIRKRDSLWCACAGSAAASLVVEGIGPMYFGEKGEIYERAHFIYEKEIKQ
jgi:sugar/nucleoside kinase (ribokinase family)